MAYEFKVRCSNCLHRLYLSDNGQLSLCNHKSIVDDDAMIALGAPEPKCLTLLKLWRLHDLKDEQAAKMPDVFYKLWQITRMQRQAQRMVRKRSQKLKYKFLDTTALQYPEDLLGDTSKATLHEKRSYAAHKVADELERRGYKVQRDIRATTTVLSGGYRHTYEYAQIASLNNVTVRMKCVPGNNTEAIFDMGLPVHHVSLIASKEIPYKLAADLTEMQYMHSLREAYIHRPVEIEYHRRLDKISKIDRRFRSEAMEYISYLKVNEPTFTLNMYGVCNDPIAYAFLLSEMRKIKRKLKNRITFKPVM